MSVYESNHIQDLVQRRVHGVEMQGRTLVTRELIGVFRALRLSPANEIARGTVSVNQGFAKI